MSKQITQMKRALGAFLRSRRESIGWNKQQLRDRTGMGGHQLDNLEDGTGNPTSDTLFAVLLELGIGLHLCEQNSDEAAGVTIEGARVPPAFLLCPDEKGGQLYVLHWQHPAFLVQVVQSIPHQLRVVATYGPTAEQVRQLPVWGELERYVKKVLAKQAANKN
jgi:transcriptional regulator with XRE-family HTH domain